MTIKEKIRALASTKGMGIPALELELGFGSSTISKWDKSAPSIDKLIKVADYFDVSLDYLSGRNEKYSDEQALLDVEISEDFELKEAIKKYYSLDDRKKKHVIELINLLSEG